MATYEFPPKVQPTEEPASTPTPDSVGSRMSQLLQWSLYGVVAMLVAGYLAIQTNPEVANYLAAVPGLGSPAQSSCALSACSKGNSEGCCSEKTSACVAACMAQHQAQELASPPAPAMPEMLPEEGVAL